MGPWLHELSDNSDGNRTADCVSGEPEKTSLPNNLKSAFTVRHYYQNELEAIKIEDIGIK